MPTTDLVFYREENGSVPALEWPEGLGNVKAIAKCRAKLMRLAALGHELRRPEADLLRDGIYELRIGFTKEAKVPASEIALAITRRKRFLLDAAAHSFRE
jgi:hypothetical protein